MIRHRDPDRKGQAKGERKPIPRFVSLIDRCRISFDEFLLESFAGRTIGNPLPDVPSEDAEQFSG
jgi:hypothetical protein